MHNIDGDYINGFIQRFPNGKYEGKLTIDGVSMDGGIEGVYFEQDHKKYLWIKRKPIMEYDIESCQYRTRKRMPTMECYLEKQIDGNTVAYKGTFVFLRFKYSIVGVWDTILGKDLKRLNLFVERLPLSEQTILRSICKRKSEKK